MKKITLLITLISLLVIPCLSGAKDVWKGYEHLFLPARNYVVYQPIDSMVIDGKVDESSWNKAAWTESFVDIEGPLKPKPAYQTKVKMLWDKNYLYLLAELEEPQIWCYYSQHDQIVFHENDFEVFIDPDRDVHNYFEFELNAANTLFDLFLPKPYRNGAKANIGWDASGFKSAVSIDGTLNNPNDKDKKWVVEMAIPFGALKMVTEFKVPTDGDIWKINFSRVEWQTTFVGGQYQKKKDEKTGRFLSEDNWVWNATGEINMHVPERWGMLRFSEQSVNNGKVKFQMPEDEELKKILWLVYYKQIDFRKVHRQFAERLVQLDILESFTTESGRKIKLTLSGTGNQFSATLTTSNAQALSINDKGQLEIVI